MEVVKSKIRLLGYTLSINGEILEARVSPHLFAKASARCLFDTFLEGKMGCGEKSLGKDRR